MNFVTYIMIGALISIIILGISKKIDRPIIIMKNKKKYNITHYMISVLIGLIVLCIIDYEKNPFFAGVVFGLIDGTVQGIFDYKDEVH